MRNTELRQIRHVIALGQHLSFTAAAKELGITQSALTRSIQAIEEQANTRLFDRDRGRVSLTEVGKAYIRRAKELLRQADDLERLLRQSASAEFGEVRYAMTSAVAAALMPEILLEEVTERPQLRQTILLRSPHAMIDLVQREEIEFCVCGEQPALPDLLRGTIIGTFRLGLFVRTGHELSASGVHLDLSGYPLLLSGQVSDADRIPAMMRPLALARPSVIVDEVALLAHLVTNSDAVWVTTPGAAAGELRRGTIRELPVPEELDLRFRVVMYSHARRSLSPGARRIADLMRARAAQAPVENP